MRTTFILSIASLSLASLCVSASVADDTNALDRRAAAIAAELSKGSKPEWAGEFYYGDGLGVNVSLIIAPDNGFTIVWSGCLGVYGQNYGAVMPRNGRLELVHELPNEPGSFGGFSRSLVPVHWGERLYLLDGDDIDGFVNTVNAGIEPCNGHCGHFLLRRGDELVPATGRPTLPAEYASKLLDAPVYASVSEIVEPDLGITDGEIRRRRATVTIDVGRAHGVWKGMELYSLDTTSRGEVYTITSIDERSSEASVTDVSEEAVVPRRGACLSTKAGVGSHVGATSPCAH